MNQPTLLESPLEEQSSTVATFTEPQEITFPESNKLIKFIPKELQRARENNNWKYPFPDININNISTTEISALFGEQFTKFLILDALVLYCQNAWRQASKTAPENPSEHFFRTFFDNRRDTITSVKLAKQAMEKMKEISKLSKKDKAQAILLMEEYRRLMKASQDLMMEELRQGRIVKDEEEE